MTMAHTEGSAPPNEARVRNGGVANTTAVERQQEQAFVRKHGPLNLRRNLLKKSSTKKRFDSGEWAMERMGFCCVDTVPADVPVEQLSPKLGPEGLPLARRRSPLEAMIWEVEYEKELSEHMDH